MNRRCDKLYFISTEIIKNLNIKTVGLKQTFIRLTAVIHFVCIIILYKSVCVRRALQSYFDVQRLIQNFRLETPVQFAILHNSVFNSICMSSKVLFK